MCSAASPEQHEKTLHHCRQLWATGLPWRERYAAGFQSIQHAAPWNPGQGLPQEWTAWLLHYRGYSCPRPQTCPRVLLPVRQAAGQPGAVVPVAQILSHAACRAVGLLTTDGVH